MALNLSRLYQWGKTSKAPYNLDNQPMGHPNDGDHLDYELDRLHANDGELEQRIINDSPQHVAAISKDLTGFPNRSDSELVFNDTTDTITLQPTAASFDTYDFGEKRTISAPISHTVTSGGHYLMLANGADTVDEAALPDVTKRLYSYYYYNANSPVKFVIQGEERHASSRDNDWHRSHHLEIGMTMPFSSSVTFTLNDPTAIQIAVESGITAYDEDLLHSVTHATTPANPFEQTLTPAAKVPVVYLDGDGLLREDTPGNEPWKIGTSLLAYNPVSGGSGSQVDVTSGKYVNYWLLFTNCQKYPLKMVQGRVLHDDIASAQGEVFESIGMPLPETFLVRQFVLYADTAITENTYACEISAVFTPARATGSSQSFSADTHNSTSGRDGTDGPCHPATAINRSATANLSQTDVESALVELSERVTVGWDSLPVGFITAVEFHEPPSSKWLIRDGSILSRTTYSALFEAMTRAKAHTLDAVNDLILCAGHNLNAGMKIRFETGTGGDFTGTGITQDTQDYYVLSSGLTTNAFKIATTKGGAAIDITGTGTAELKFRFFGVIGPGDGATTFQLPDDMGIAERNAGTSSTYQKADGNFFAGGNVGDQLNDQAQAWQLGASADLTGARDAWGNAEWRDVYHTTTSSANYSRMDLRTDTQGVARMLKAMDDGTYGAPRQGDETRPASRSVLPIIKAEV